MVFDSQMPVNIENCMKCDLIHGKSVTLTNPEKQRQAFWVEIISCNITKNRNMVDFFRSNPLKMGFMITTVFQ